MYSGDTEEDLSDYHDEEDDDQPQQSFTVSSDPPPPPCSRGHRSTVILRTIHGGAICLLCFSNLVSDPLSPTLHVSYALSQLSRAVSDPNFLRSLLAAHHRLLVSPLARSLASSDDPALARQLLRLVAALSSSSSSAAAAPLRAGFVAELSGQLSSASLAWTPRHVHTLHCLGTLLNFQDDNPCSFIKDKYGLVSNLVGGLQLPSDGIRGEILFVLYKLSILQYASEDEDGTDFLSPFCPKLLRFSLDALVKIQSDDVRLNCVALLTVLAQRGFFRAGCSVDSMLTYQADSLIQEAEDGADVSPLSILFSEAIKGPLLSTDSQVQISSVNLLFHYMSGEGTSSEDIQVLVEENIADYVFEILRLSERKDPVVSSCLQVLDLLSTAKQTFNQRLVVGFVTLIPVLQYVAEIPFHPVQSQTLRLIWNCVSDYPGIASASQIKELVTVLTRMLEKHADGEVGMLQETFMMACSIFVSLLKSPASLGTFDLEMSVKEASKHAVLSCLSVSEKDTSKVLHSLNLLKEVYACTHEENFAESCNIEVRDYILDLCTLHVLPWFVNFFKEIEEEIVLGVLETFHSVLLWESDIQVSKFAENLVSSSWFSLSFECLGLFPSKMMKRNVYLILGSLVGVILRNDSGQSIKDAALCLPSDPIDLLFLLGQKSSYSLELSCSQSAILTILYTSSLYDERLADDKLVLGSLEAYILANGSEFRSGVTNPSFVSRFLYLYGFYRGLAKVSYQIPYNPEAERILVQLVNKNEWDLVSARIHPISLKWLFQQEKFCEPLSDQIIKLCGSNVLYDSDIISDEQNSSNVNVKELADLVASGDNYAARLVVCLLTKLGKEEAQESNITYLVNLVTRIVNICPTASDELCLNNIGNVIHNLLCEKIHSLSSQISTPLLILIFNLLSLVYPETLSDDDEIWAAVITKLIEYASTDPARWTHDNLLVIGILSLVLNRSTTNTLTEASKTILFSSPLLSTIDSMIHEACQKGPALVDHDEGTSYGEKLLFVLLLNYFSLKSLCAILPGSIDWQSFLDPPDRTQELSLIGIPCHDLCRLMYYGSPLVKLVASHCLVELFTGICDQGNTESDELKCTVEYLMSVITVLEGFVFYSDQRVALNCSLCISLVFGCETLDTQDKGVTGRNNWSRLIVEELAASLSAPSLASKSFISHHKPAIYIAIALLKQEKIPDWTRAVFIERCISGIIENLTASNVSSEIVVLFGELQTHGFLKTEQIGSLNQVLQACRKRLYTENSKGDSEDENMKKVVTISGDLGDVCEYLICLMSSKSSRGRDFGEVQSGNRTLLEEIELFFTSAMIEDDS